MMFYMLDRKTTHGKVPFTTSDAYSGCEIVDCAICGTRGMVGKYKLGKVPVEIIVKDVVDELDDIESASTVLLASSKFREVVTSACLTGIKFYPPLAYVARNDDKRFEEMLRKCQERKKYEIIHVTGTGGSAAKTSGLELLKSCDYCGWNEWSLPADGFHVDERQWDGSDFFHIREFGPFFMTKKAKDVLESSGLTSFAARRISEYTSPFI